MSSNIGSPPTKGRPVTSSPEKRREDARRRAIRYREREQGRRLVAKMVAEAFGYRPTTWYKPHHRQELPRLLAFACGAGEDLECHITFDTDSREDCSKMSRFSEVLDLISSQTIKLTDIR